MSSGNSPVLALDLPGGWRHAAPAVTLLAAALLFPWLAAVWPMPVRVAVGVGGLALAACAAWQAGVVKAARRITRVIWDQQGEWHLHFAEGESSEAKLAAGSWQTPWVMCWRWMDTRGHHHGLMLWRTQLSSSEWHRWQLRLRLEGSPAGTTVTGAVP